MADQAAPMAWDDRARAKGRRPRAVADGTGSRVPRGAAGRAAGRAGRAARSRGRARSGADGGHAVPLVRVPGAAPDLDRHVLHRLGEYGRRPPAVIQIIVDDGALPADHLSADGTDLGHRPPPLLGERVRWYMVDGVLSQGGRRVRATGVPCPGREPARVWVAADDDPSLDGIIASIAPAPARPGQSQPSSVGCGKPRCQTP
ncbi:hypothetical protein [Actinomadura sp. 6K520]|uniref:hypothetical protein n=1 Tax=Actinomadura sp. 6K520 TaxID=2530364 RepID=UPI001049C9A8|nr:hypothetical protein [Actinomadura sp. 6K520]TDE33670.1 hypothetical protein E1289_11790 [Actinomadura sp. 6K520]